jgi:hypothetical protein
MILPPPADVPRIPSLVQELAEMGVVGPELAGEAYERRRRSYWRQQGGLERYLVFLRI